MKKLKGFLQGFIIVLLAISNILILIHFFVDFFGFKRSNTILQLFKKGSSPLVAPFDGIVSPYITSESIVNYSAIIAFVFYTLLGIFLLKIVNIFLSIEISRKSTKLTGQLFNFIIAIFGFKLIFSVLNGENISFHALISNFTNLFTNSILSLVPESLKSTITLNVVIIIIVIILFLVKYLSIDFLNRILDQKTSPKQVYQPSKAYKAKETPATSKEEEEFDKIIKDQDPEQKSAPMQTTQKKEAEQDLILEPVDEAPSSTPAQKSTFKTKIGNLWEKTTKKTKEVVGDLFNLQNGTAPKVETPFRKKDGSKDTEKSPLAE